MPSVEPAPPQRGASTLPAAWPDGVRLKPLGDPNVVTAFFEDAPTWHGGMVVTLLALANDPAHGRRYQGARGIKVDGIHRVDSPELRLATARAEALFRRVVGAPQAVTDAAWANIYHRGDYCMPHSHMRATASIVYCVDPGDDDPDDPLSGRLFIADPRLAACCQPVQNYMTSPIVPKMRPGTFVIFPAQIVHAVNPYNGQRPRITLSWNIGPEAVSQPVASATAPTRS
jgi:hypothetical protein